MITSRVKRRDPPNAGSKIRTALRDGKVRPGGRTRRRKARPTADPDPLTIRSSS